LEKAGSNAGECLFIDDTQKNIDAATELGFQTLLFITPEQFLQDITPLVQR
jgi:FMN phosphatase YigB (HAD superfamily)